MKRLNSKTLLLFCTTLLFLSCNTYKPAVIGESLEKYKATWKTNKSNGHPDLYYQDSTQTIYLYCTEKKKDFFTNMNIGGAYKPTYTVTCAKGIYYTFKKGVCVSVDHEAPIKINK